MSEILYDDFKDIMNIIGLKDFTGKTFLITGATGFLAKYLVQLLCYINRQRTPRNQCKILALCRNKNKALKIYGADCQKDSLIILEQGVEDQIVYDGSVDYIIHAASKANTKEFGIDPVGVLSANTIGTFNLLSYARDKKVKGFLFLSSGAIYGNAVDVNLPIKENQYFPLDPFDIRNCYAGSKKMGEIMCNAFYNQYGVPTKIARIAHTYGPGIDLKDGRVFSDFVSKILSNKDIVMNSDGSAKRPFCYVSDAAIAIFLILFRGRPGEAYNLANNNCFISINELAHILVNEVFKEKNLKIRYKKSQYLTSNNQGNVTIDTTKLNSLGWQPQIGIEEGFRRTVESFQESG